jgi:outer membrane protein assembly factor BamB
MRLPAVIALLAFAAVSPARADNPPPLLWQYNLQAPSFGSAAAGDIDRDGKPEIIFGTYFGDEHAYALNAEDDSLKWRFPGGGGPLDASAAVADVNGDGNLEVLVAASWGIEYCLDGSGNEIWRYPRSGYIDCIDSPSAVADVDNDGKPEVIFGAWSGKVYVLNGEDGSLVWDADLGASDYIQSQPAVLDVDGDSQLDIVVASFSGAAKVWALRGSDKQLLWTFQAGDYMYHGPSFADIDEDGKPELAISCCDGYLYVINAEDGSECWKYPAGETMYSPVALADLNNDGHLELAASGNTLFVLSHTGQKLWSYPTGGSVFRGPTVADVDGDGWLDLAFGSSDTVLRVLKGVDGSEIWSWDLGGDNEIDHAPVIADFDGDGDLDLFFVAGYWDSPGNHGQAYALHTGAGTGPGWPMFAHDLVHSGCFVRPGGVLYRGVVSTLAPGWQTSSLPLTSGNDTEDSPFPFRTALPGSIEDTIVTDARLILYRVLSEAGTPVGNSLHAARSPAGVNLSY